MSFFGLNFGGNADLDIVLDHQDERKMADIKDENGRKERHYLYLDGETVSGKVNVTLHRKTNKLEHHGLKIEFIGQIELYYDRGNHHEFLSLVKQLAGPGELTQNTAFDFEFNQVEKPFECYTGANVRLRYFLRVTMVRRLTDMVKEMDLLVHTLATYPEMNNPIKMEVGIEECLHIEFEYNKSKYHLKDVIVGKIYFLLVRIKIKHMEVAIIKRETTGSGPNTFHDNETIAKYEIMDGAPVRGESIPIRVFLAGYDLTPTMRDINKKFSVKYYLNLVLVDEEERRYFKQQEITLWRKGERQIRKGQQQQQMQMSLPHAMARHIAGDVPTQNIRTAPTPSEPNTPVAGYMQQQVHGMPGPGMYQQQQQRLIKEEVKEEEDEEEEREPVQQQAVPQMSAESVKEEEERKPVQQQAVPQMSSEPVKQEVEEEEKKPVQMSSEPVKQEERKPVQQQAVPQMSSEPVKQEVEEEERKPVMVTPKEEASSPDAVKRLQEEAAPEPQAVSETTTPPTPPTAKETPAPEQPSEPTPPPTPPAPTREPETPTSEHNPPESPPPMMDDDVPDDEVHEVPDLDDEMAALDGLPEPGSEEPPSSEKVKREPVPS